MLTNDGGLGVAVQDWNDAQKVLNEMPLILESLHTGGTITVDQFGAAANALNFADKLASLSKWILASWAHFHIDHNGIEHAEAIDDPKERMSFEAIAPYFGKTAGTIKTWVYAVAKMTPELQSRCDGTLVTPSHLKTICAYDIPEESRLAIVDAVAAHNAEHMANPENVEWWTETNAGELAAAEQKRLRGQPAAKPAKEVARVSMLKSPIISPDQIMRSDYAHFFKDTGVPMNYTDPKTGVTREVLGIQPQTVMLLMLGDVVKAQAPAEKSKRSDINIKGAKVAVMNEDGITEYESAE